VMAKFSTSRARVTQLTRTTSNIKVAKAGVSRNQWRKRRK
jgi:hypothetical protein